MLKHRSGGLDVELSERKEKILSAIIERFLTTGEPVGSKFIVDVLTFPVSSATVRNEMAYLSDMGYLDQPHTSAGRIPSDKGYRYYIDRLLRNYSPSDADMFRILSSIDRSEGDSVGLLSQLCGTLSTVTGLTAVAVTPHSERAVITGTQVVPLSTKTAMVIVRTSAGVTKSRTAKLEVDPDYELVELFYNVTGANFIGVQAAEFTTAKLQCAAAALGEKSLDIMPLIVSFFEAALEASGADVIVKGHDYLLSSSELSSTALEIMELMRNKNAAAHIMETGDGEALELSIGAENEYQCLRHAAVIKAPYKAGEDAGGSIGVIGPTKTDYSRVIPLVKYISEIASAILGEVTDK